MSDCNCDLDYVCSDECLDKICAYGETFRWEFVRFGVPDENGKIVDVRDQ